MQLYNTPSGMGGSFDVKIKQAGPDTIEGIPVAPELAPGYVNVRIHMPGNPDFHGYEFMTRLDALKPI